MLRLKLLAMLCVVFLTGCAPRLTLISPPVDPELLAGCGIEVAEPLTAGDQYDLSRALTQAIGYGKSCRARQDALVSAVKVREAMMESVKSQLEGAK